MHVYLIISYDLQQGCAIATMHVSAQTGGTHQPSLDTLPVLAKKSFLASFL